MTTQQQLGAKILAYGIGGMLLVVIVWTLFVIAFVPLVITAATLLAGLSACAIVTEGGKRVASVDALLGVSADETLDDAIARHDADAAAAVRARQPQAQQPSSWSPSPQPSQPQQRPSVGPTLYRGADAYSRLAAAHESRIVVIPSQAALCAAIAEKVIGQTAAIDALARLVRAQLGSHDDTRRKPAVALLPGPTGVGKTEMAKAIASVLDTNLVRIDCEELSESHTSSKLFGSPPGYAGSDKQGLLPQAIRENPEALVLLFDEIEKADKSIWQKLLAFLDEGRASDNFGEAIAAKNTLILLTTNLCASEIAADPDRARAILAANGFFSREMLGRIDKIVPLPPLVIADMLHLTDVLLTRLCAIYGLTPQVDDATLGALYAQSADAAKDRGGRGITECLRDLLIDDLLKLKAAGATQCRIVVEGEAIHALA